MRTILDNSKMTKVTRYYYSSKYGAEKREGGRSASDLNQRRALKSHEALSFMAGVGNYFLPGAT